MSALKKSDPSPPKISNIQNEGSSKRDSQIKYPLLFFFFSSICSLAGGLRSPRPFNPRHSRSRLTLLRTTGQVAYVASFPRTHDVFRGLRLAGTAVQAPRRINCGRATYRPLLLLQEPALFWSKCHGISMRQRDLYRPLPSHPRRGQELTLLRSKLHGRDRAAGACAMSTESDDTRVSHRPHPRACLAKLFGQRWPWGDINGHAPAHQREARPYPPRTHHCLAVGPVWP